MHRIGLVFGLGRNVVHLDRPSLHGFGRVVREAGVVLAHTHVAVLEDGLELRHVRRVRTSVNCHHGFWL